MRIMKIMNLLEINVRITNIMKNIKKQQYNEDNHKKINKKNENQQKNMKFKKVHVRKNKIMKT